jgi:hypothetical protein
MIALRGGFADRNLVVIWLDQLPATRWNSGSKSSAMAF